MCRPSDMCADAVTAANRMHRGRAAALPDLGIFKQQLDRTLNCRPASRLAAATRSMRGLINTSTPLRTLQEEHKASDLETRS